MALHNKEKLQLLLDFATTGKAFCYIHQAELRPREDDNDFFAATVAGFCYYRWRFLLHPVDKKASTRQRNTGKVTTLLTQSFNPQMKKLQTEIEKILLDDDHGVSLCFCCNRRVKSYNTL